MARENPLSTKRGKGTAGTAGRARGRTARHVASPRLVIRGKSSRNGLTAHPGSASIRVEGGPERKLYGP